MAAVSAANMMKMTIRKTLAARPPGCVSGRKREDLAGAVLNPLFSLISPLLLTQVVGSFISWFGRFTTPLPVLASLISDIIFGGMGKKLTRR